jgi:serine carboxypeptidase-like clade I
MQSNFLNIIYSSMFLNFLILCGVLVFSFTSLIEAAITKDKVTSLPGYVGNLPSTHYSGLIPVGNLSGVAGHLHYWFIESTNKPSEDPIVLWLNGGPGSSSLIGLLTENGQLVLNDDSLENTIDGIPQLFVNEYAWTTVANVIYLESPKGVGFSYCDDAKTSKDCVNSDESTALDAYEFLVNFFKGFPEYKTNKFYITGESYAGIYIPMLMDQVNIDPLDAKLNLIGSAIGNGCWGNTVGTCDFYSPEAIEIQVEFYHGHGMYSDALYQEIKSSCGSFDSLSARCMEKVSKIPAEVGKFNVYDIYDECGKDQRRRLSKDTVAAPALDFIQGAKKVLAQKQVLVDTKESFSVNAGYGQALNDYSCGAETAMDVWLAEPSVAEALHVSLGTVGMMYNKTATDLLPLYSSLIDKYQMLIYSGDVDGCVPYVGTEKWTRGLGYTVTNDWHQWLSAPDDKHNLHKAGYAVTFDKFQFITINGAGHMVPEFQPAYALTMFKKFLANETF